MKTNNFVGLRFPGLEKAILEDGHHIVLGRSQEGFREVRIKKHDSENTFVYSGHANLIPALVLADFRLVTENPTQLDYNFKYFGCTKVDNEYDSHLDWWIHCIHKITIEATGTGEIKSSALNFQDYPFINCTNNSLTESLISLNEWVSQQKPEDAVYKLLGPNK